ncbi:MAG: hypothetical protein QOE36_277 [Gaiellaceae bacterium]|nr:hypothetical protein [Gaiellaceae bacterium]
MDGDEIARRLVYLKGAKSECSQCGKAKWLNPTLEGRAVMLVTNGEITDQYDFIMLICENCGFVRLHDEERLHD